MGMLSKVFFIALIVLLTGATSASANDLCVLDTTFGNLFVAKNLTLPTANNCKTFNGFLAATDSAVFGNVCKTHDNQAYFFNLHHSADNNIRAASVTFYLLVSTLTGFGVFDNGNLTFFYPQKVPCPATRHFGR